MNPSVRWLHSIAVLCLFLSGAAGLVYQVVWMRYLSLLLGHTSYAVIAVLVAFMGGLALGNAWLGRVADRIQRPLSLYAWLEIGIAVYAVVFPLYFGLCERIFIAVGHGAVGGSVWLFILRFLMSFAVILVPTTLMGGTLPILTRMVTRSLGELQARVGALYFFNSLGAVAGVLIAEFWWIPSLGLDTTVWGGAVLNLAVGIIALGVAARIPDQVRPFADSTPTAAGGGAGGGAEAASGEESEGEEAEVYSEWELRLAVAAAGLSGFVAMLYEIVWTRLLALSLGSSTRAFAIMLATFITGIAAGAWWVTRWKKLRRTLDAFGWAELALALSLAVSMFFYDLLPYAFVKLGGMVARNPNNFPLFALIQFLICFAVMFVPTFCLGLTLPLASRVATTELSRTGRSVGLVFSVNTIGTVLGAAMAGLLLLPMLGLARAFGLGVGLNLALALAVLLRHRAGVRRALPILGPAVVAGVVLVTHLTLHTLWQKSFSLGLFRVTHPPPTLEAYRKMVDGVNIKYHKDAAGSTVMVHTWTNAATGTVELTLRVNGKADATSRGDLPTQLLAGHLPMLLSTNVEEALVVGIGSGISCGAVLTYPEVKRLDVVEISREVWEAARTLFARYNHGALDSDRAEVVLDDAKAFLKTSGRKYDLIVSEPSNPWMAGVSGVFSLEYYEACRASMKPGGRIAQWVQVYESNDDTLNTILATFTSVFPFATLWQTLPGDLLLIGSTEPLPVDLESVRRRFAIPAVTADLRRADIFTLPVVLGLQVISEGNTAFVAPDDSPRHSDHFPILEYQAEVGLFARDTATIPEIFDENSLCRPNTLLARYLERYPLQVEDMQSLALFQTSYGLPHPRVLRSVLELWRREVPDSTLAAELSAKLDFPLPVSELQALRMGSIRDLMLTNSVENLEALRMYSRHLMHAYRYLRSVYYQPPTAELAEVLQRLIDVDVENRQTHLLRLAEIAWDSGDEPAFAQLAARAFVPEAGAPRQGKFDLDYQAPGRVLYRMLETLWRERRFADARAWAEAVRDGGYLSKNSRTYHPMLGMMMRKVESTITPETLAPAPQALPAPSATAPQPSP